MAPVQSPKEQPLSYIPPGHKFTLDHPPSINQLEGLFDLIMSDEKYKSGWLWAEAYYRAEFPYSEWRISAMAKLFQKLIDGGVSKATAVIEGINLICEMMLSQTAERMQHIKRALEVTPEPQEAPSKKLKLSQTPSQATSSGNKTVSHIHSASEASQTALGRNAASLSKAKRAVDGIPAAKAIFEGNGDLQELLETAAQFIDDAKIFDTLLDKFLLHFGDEVKRKARE
jgi:hypothetical protein